MRFGFLGRDERLGDRLLLGEDQGRAAVVGAARSAIQWIMAWGV